MAVPTGDFHRAANFIPFAGVAVTAQSAFEPCKYPLTCDTAFSAIVVIPSSLIMVWRSPPLCIAIDNTGSCGSCHRESAVGGYSDQRSVPSLASVVDKNPCGNTTLSTRRRLSAALCSTAVQYTTVHGGAKPNRRARASSIKM